MDITLSKRNLLRGACCGAIALAPALAAGIISPAAAQTAPAPVPTGLSPDAALELLVQGNDDFVNDRFQPVQMDRKRRLEIANEQHPFAVLVGCSDSRVPPELLFGRGLGDLFIVRVAGNTVDLTGLGSIEYAVEHLGVPLIVVMGHERCGAVAAAVGAVADDPTYDSAIEAMIAPIIPAVLKAQTQEGDLLDNAVRENVRRVVERLKTSGPIVMDRLESGGLKIVGARYDLDDGKVEYIA